MDLSPLPEPAPLLHGFTLDDLQELDDENPSLRGYLQGYLAERRLTHDLLCLPDVSRVTKIPDSDRRRGDLLVEYRGQEISIESKSLSSGLLREDILGNRSLHTPIA